MTGDAPATPRRDADDPWAVPHARRNVPLLVLDGFVFALGFNFLSPVAIMPVFIARLTPIDVLAGSFTALEQIGIALPKFVAARWTERAARAGRRRSVRHQGGGAGRDARGPGARRSVRHKGGGAGRDARGPRGRRSGQGCPRTKRTAERARMPADPVHPTGSWRDTTAAGGRRNIRMARPAEWHGRPSGLEMSRAECEWGRPR